VTAAEYNLENRLKGLKGPDMRILKAHKCVGVFV
jgi:hypothetical protein